MRSSDVNANTHKTNIIYLKKKRRCDSCDLVYYKFRFYGISTIPVYILHSFILLLRFSLAFSFSLLSCTFTLQWCTEGGGDKRHAKWVNRCCCCCCCHSQNEMMFRLSYLRIVCGVYSYCIKNPFVPSFFSSFLWLLIRSLVIYTVNIKSNE